MAKLLEASAEDAIAERFCATWQRCAPGDSDTNTRAIWQQVRGHYNETHRRYHTLEHIAHCLNELDGARHLTNEADVIELGIWFHDVIYAAGDADCNEARSAELLRTLARGLMPDDIAARLEALILATTHAGPEDDAAVQIMVDIDLSSIGLAWTVFLENSKAIQHEQQLPPEAEDAFLTTLERREQIYHTDHFHSRLESSARQNIARYRAVCTGK